MQEIVLLPKFLFHNISIIWFVWSLYNMSIKLFNTYTHTHTQTHIWLTISSRNGHRQASKITLAINKIARLQCICNVFLQYSQKCRYLFCIPIQLNPRKFLWVIKPLGWWLSFNSYMRLIMALSYFSILFTGFLGI